MSEKIVFTNGCFDIIHRGHVEYLEDAKALGDILIIGLNSDSSVSKLKGKNRPINKEEDRAKVLLGLKSVDGVIIFEEDAPFELVERIKPDILVKGGDWEIEQIAGHKFVLENGGEVLTIPFRSDCSTSKIIEKIRSLYE
jgi:rfaE bifunctional protein nucleotidyltransferase chain/domain